MILLSWSSRDVYYTLSVFRKILSGRLILLAAHNTGWYPQYPMGSFLQPREYLETRNGMPQRQQR